MKLLKKPSYVFSRKWKEKEKGSGTMSVLALGEQNFPTSIRSLDIQNKEKSCYCTCH